MTDSTVGAISTAFQDEGFAPNPECSYTDSSVRRETTQSYLDSVNWTDPGHVARCLRVAERLLGGFEAHNLRRSTSVCAVPYGYLVDDQTGQINPVGRQLPIESMARLADASAIREGASAESDEPLVTTPPSPSAARTN